MWGTLGEQAEVSFPRGSAERSREGDATPVTWSGLSNQPFWVVLKVGTFPPLMYNLELTANKVGFYLYTVVLSVRPSDVSARPAGEGGKKDVHMHGQSGRPRTHKVTVKDQFNGL